MAKRKRNRHRYPTPDEMEVLDALLESDREGLPPEVAAASADPAWRKLRQLARRMSYEEREGKPHPAWDTSVVTDDPRSVGREHTAEIDPLSRDDFLAIYTPPSGMRWAEFGLKWDFGPFDHDVILRHANIEGQWRGRMMKSASPLPMTPMT